MNRGRITEGAILRTFMREAPAECELYYSEQESWRPPFAHRFLYWRMFIDGQEYGNGMDVPLTATEGDMVEMADALGRHATQVWEVAQMTPEQRENLRQMVLAPTDEPVSTVIQTSGVTKYKKVIIIESGEPTE